MVLICSLKICRNVTGKGKFQAHRYVILIFRFPADPNIAEKWLLRLKEIQPSYEQTKSAVACSAYFLDSDYTMSGSKKVLNKNVIPSVFKESMYLLYYKINNSNFIKILLLLYKNLY